MNVYRITLNKWAYKLQASGFPGRWNTKGKYVIYTSNSRALASLENLAHRSGEGLNDIFSTIVIALPKSLKIKVIDIKDLPSIWYKYEQYPICQNIGDQWIDEGDFGILRVPSAIIKMEYNFLINPNHEGFKKIKIIKTEKFEFDPRLSK